VHLAIKEWVLLAVLLGWFLASVLNQFKHPWIAALKPRDLFHLIPNWRFFAPIPARRDYHLEYRLMTNTARVTRWQRVTLLPDQRNWWVIWNPRKRVRKSFNTAVRRIVRRLRSGYSAAATSVSYLQILHYLEHADFSAKSRRVQFRIVTCQDFAGDPRLRLVFTSSWHVRR
jgi:hypothetical protein